MPEHELKFYIPGASLYKLELALRRGRVEQTELRAQYFDTASRELASQKIALRLRLEGQHWVQTLKMPGEGLLSRLEFNHPRSGPELDLRLYQGTPAARVLERLAQPLTIRYETQVMRTLRLLRVPGALLEIALDRGFIQASSLQLPVQELEIELKRGSSAALLACAKKWQQAHPLILDLRSKSERGDQLAALALRLDELQSQNEIMPTGLPEQAVAAFWKPQLSQPITLRPAMTARDAMAAVMSECVEQISRNAALLAGVDATESFERETSEYVHQLRVGIRRLRSACALFKGICELPTPQSTQFIKSLFGQLGSRRDDDVLLQSLWPRLQAAGQPPLRLTVATQADFPERLVRSPTFQAWQLDMLAFLDQAGRTSAPAPPLSDPHAPSLKKLLRLRLQRWHRQVLSQGLRFETLSMEDRHALRKRLKRLRYALQFANALLPRGKIKPYLKQLACLQDLLGQMNDLVVAHQFFETLSQSQPSAWFACGWIKSELGYLDAKIIAAFKRWAKTDQYWQ